MSFSILQRRHTCWHLSLKDVDIAKISISHETIAKNIKYFSRICG